MVFTTGPLNALVRCSKIATRKRRTRNGHRMWGGRASPVASIATWKSPVLLIHGDDDRNVRFSQTTDLVQRLEKAGVTYEELIIPDDTHHFMRHANIVTVDSAVAAFFDRAFGINRGSE